jgi:hypothetical protein
MIAHVTCTYCKVLREVLFAFYRGVNRKDFLNSSSCLYPMRTAKSHKIVKIFLLENFLFQSRHEGTIENASVFKFSEIDDMIT